MIRPHQRYLVLALLAAFTVIGLGLRWRHSDFGLPNVYHPDELRKVPRMVAMLDEGRLDPDYFHHPGFLLYSGAAWIGLARAFGAQASEVVAWRLAREWVGLLGALTIPLAFWLGRELVLGRRRIASALPSAEDARLADLAGLTAAALLAVLPLAVVSAHYVKEDVPLTLWSTLATIFSLRIARAGRTRDYYLATVFAALATATKYSGALNFFVVGIAHALHAQIPLRLATLCQALRPWARGGRRTLLLALMTVAGALVAKKHGPGWVPFVLIFGGAMSLLSLSGWVAGLRRAQARPRLRLRLRHRLGLTALAVFLLMNPFAMLNYRLFGDHFDYENRHALIKGHHGIQVSPWRQLWTFHLRHSLLPGLTLPAFVASLAATAALARSRERGARLAVLTVALWYVAHEASSLKPPPNFDRYMNPLLPLLAAATGWGLVRLLETDDRNGCYCPTSGRRTGRAPTLCLAAAGLLLLLAVPFWRSVALVEQMKPDTRTQARAWLRQAHNIPPGSRVLSTGYDGLDDAVDLPFVRFVSSYMHTRRGDEGPLDLDLAAFPRDGQAWPVDYVVTSSFWIGRYETFAEEAYSGRHEGGREFYERLEDVWGPPAMVFDAPHGPYGYNNPTIRIYRAPQRE